MMQQEVIQSYAFLSTFLPFTLVNNLIMFVSGFLRSRFLNDSKGSASSEMIRTGTGHSLYQQQNSNIVQPSNTNDHQVDSNDINDTRHISIQCLISCYHQYKAKGRIGPHLSSPILSLASVSPDECRQQSMTEPQTETDPFNKSFGTDPSNKSFGSIVGGIPRTFTSRSWDSLAGDNVTNLPRRPMEAVGRGRGTMQHQATDSTPFLSGRGGQPNSVTVGRGRGRSPGVIHSVPGGDSGDPTVDHSEQQRTVHREGFSKHSRFSNQAEGVPLWRRKDLSGSETADTSTQHPPQLTTAPAQSVLPSSSIFTATTTPVQSSKPEPGQAGFLIGRSDSARIIASGLPPLTPSGIHTPAHGKTVSGSLDERRFIRIQDEPNVKSILCKNLGTMEAVSMSHNQIAQAGKFGVRDSTWVEDDWGNIRRQGSSTISLTAQQPKSSSLLASDEPQHLSAGASPQTQVDDDWIRNPSSSPVSLSREDMVSLSSQGANPSIRKKEAEWDQPPSRIEQNGSQQSEVSKFDWSYSGARQSLNKPPTTSITQSSSFWDTSPIDQKDREQGEKNEVIGRDSIHAPIIPPKSSCTTNVQPEFQVSQMSATPPSFLVPTASISHDAKLPFITQRDLPSTTDETRGGLFKTLTQRQFDSSLQSTTPYLTQLRQQQQWFPQSYKDPSDVVPNLISEIMRNGSASSPRQPETDLLKQLIDRVVGRQSSSTSTHQLSSSTDCCLQSQPFPSFPPEGQTDNSSSLLQAKLDAVIQSALKTHGASLSSHHPPGSAASILQQLARERLARYSAIPDSSYGEALSSSLVPGLELDQAYHPSSRQSLISELFQPPQQPLPGTSSLSSEVPNVLNTRASRQQYQSLLDIYPSQQLNESSTNTLLRNSIQCNSNFTYRDDSLQSHHRHQSDRLWQQPSQDCEVYQDRPRHVPMISHQHHDNFFSDKTLDVKLVEPDDRSNIPARNSETKLPISLEDPVWEYRDPKGQIQGPFSSIQMKSWYDGNFFPDNLLMRYNPNNPWVKFRELFPVKLNMVFPPFTIFPIVGSDGSIDHLGNQQSQQLILTTPPPELDRLSIQQQTSPWDNESPAPSPSSIQSGACSGSIGTSPPLAAIDNLHLLTSHQQGSSQQFSLSPQRIAQQQQNHLIEDEQIKPTAKRHDSELMTSGLKAMLGLSTSNATSHSESSDISMVRDQAQQQSLVEQSGRQQPKPPTEFKNDLQRKRPLAAPSVLIPSPVSGVAIPPTRKPKPIESAEPPERVTIEHRPLRPIQPRAPVQDLLEVMHEEELRTKQERQLMLKQSQELDDTISSRGKGATAWKVPAASTPAVFDESDFPDPSAALFQSKSLSGRLRQKTDVQLASGKGGKKTSLSDFFKSESKSQPVRIGKD